MAFEGLDFYALDEELTEEERLVRDTVRRMVDEEVIPIIAEHYQAGTFPMHLIPQLRRAGPARREPRGLRLRRAWATSPTA